MSQDAELQMGVEARETFVPRDEPYYLSVSDEVEIFEAAYRPACRCCSRGRPDAARPASSSTWLIGSRLSRRSHGTHHRRLPRGFTGSDLVGRYLIQADETVWMMDR